MIRININKVSSLVLCHICCHSIILLKITSSQRKHNSVPDRTIVILCTSTFVLLIPKLLHQFSAEWDMFNSLLHCRKFLSIWLNHRNKQVKNITVQWSMNVCQLTCHSQKIVWISSMRHWYLNVHSNDDFVKESPCLGEFLLVGTTNSILSSGRAKINCMRITCIKA